MKKLDPKDIEAAREAAERQLSSTKEEAQAVAEILSEARKAPQPDQDLVDDLEATLEGLTQRIDSLRAWLDALSPPSAP